MSIASPLEVAMLKLINAERLAVGVAPVQFDGLLNDAAEDHSSSMLVNNIFSHTGADGSTPRERMQDAGYVFEGANASGENIGWQSERGAAGLLDDVQDIHDSLMDSPGHRANILSANFDEIGIGIVEGRYTTNGRTFDAVMVTQNFAKTDAPDLPGVVTPKEPTVVVETDPVEPLVTPVVTPTVEDEPDTPVLPPRRPETKDEEGDDDTDVVVTPEKPGVDVDDKPAEPVEELAVELDDDKPEEPVVVETEPVEDDEEVPETDTKEPVEERPVEPIVTEFEFKEEDEPETTGEPKTPSDTGYVWTKTHDDETYAKVITDFTASCTAEAFATLDQELQAFVLREFECDFAIA